MKDTPLVSPTIMPDLATSIREQTPPESFLLAHLSSSSKDSLNDGSIFSAESNTSTDKSEIPAAFAEGWKAAMRQTGAVDEAAKSYVFTDVDYFALDIVRVLDSQLAGGKRLMAGGQPRSPDECEIDLCFPALFRSICVCDMSIIGNPIQLHSRHFSPSPRVLRVREAQFLNLPRQQKHACHLSFRPGPEKEPQYILEYSNALVSSEGGKLAYVMATQMDVTPMINALSELLNAKYWIAKGKQIDSKTMKHGAPSGRKGSSENVDWISLANEQAGKADQDNAEARAEKDDLITEDPSILEFSEMIEDIKHFHSDCLTLVVARETTGDTWKISYLSPSLAKQIDDVKVSFNQTPPAAMIKLGMILAGDTEGSVVIKWGVKGDDKRIYCCPMFRNKKNSWLCFLVNEDIGDLWDLKYSKVPSP